MNNQLKTILLLAALTSILLFIGSFFGRGGLLIGFIFALLMNVGSYFFSDKLVLAMYRARDAPQTHYADLHRSVEKIAQEAGIPKPRIVIIPTPGSNAFATGRNPKHAVVAVTEGIMKLLSKHELEGVLAHEIAHIKNRDILIATIATTLASVISYISHFAYFIPLNRDNNGHSNILHLLVLMIVAPIAAMIIQLAISRSREYLADASGAKYIQNGKPLADALRKLELDSKRRPLLFGNEATASLFIVNPFSGRAFINLFSTHPPMHVRIQKFDALRF